MASAITKFPLCKDLPFLMKSRNVDQKIIAKSKQRLCSCLTVRIRVKEQMRAARFFAHAIFMIIPNICIATVKSPAVADWGGGRNTIGRYPFRKDKEQSSFAPTGPAIKSCNKTRLVSNRSFFGDQSGVMVQLFGGANEQQLADSTTGKKYLGGQEWFRDRTQTKLWTIDRTRRSKRITRISQQITLSCDHLGMTDGLKRKGSFV